MATEDATLEEIEDKDDRLIPEDQIPDFERLFAEEGRTLLLERLRLGLAVGVALYIAFAALDYVVVGEGWMDFLRVRLIAAVFPLATIPLTKTAFGRRWITPLSMGIMYIGAASMIWMTTQLGGFASDYFMGIMLAMFLVGLFFPWGVKRTALFSAAVLGSYVGANGFLVAPSPLAVSILPIFFLIGTCVLTVWASGAIEKSRRAGLRMRMQLEVANEGLKELDKAKTGFFANVSHELRTPLMLILGPLESLMRGDAGDPAPLLRAMNANAHRLLRQVNTILDFSKIADGRMECNREMDSVGKVLEQLIEGAAPFAEGRGTELRLEGIDDLPEIPIDAEHIETAAANLLSNALKFTPDDGRVTVRAGHDAGKVWVEVEDTGCGIPEDQQAKVFERFHQVDGGKGGKIQGTGLGLALSKSLVELHGGRMSVSSVYGEGTTFRIELPTLEYSDFEGSAAQDPSAEKKEVQTVQRANSDQTRYADLIDKTLEDHGTASTADPDAPLLLVVEDNPDMRAFISQSLARRYRVETAADGALGLEAARRTRPDMIVSDVQMPNMDGFEMVGELRKDKSFDKTPIIMLTAKTGSDAVVKGLSLGAVDYVNKPFKLVEIEARIEAQLRAQAMERTLDERDSRLIAVGQMTGTIAHDMRGPLTAIFNRIETLRLMADLAGNLGSMDDDLSKVENTVKRINGMIQELLEFVRGNNVTLDLQPTALSPFLDEMAEDLVPTLAGLQVELHRSFDGDAATKLPLDRDRIARVIENLVNNSRDAIAGAEGRDGGNVWISTRIEDGKAFIRVTDDGPGIPDAAAKKLFQPFATAGKANGTGLGLSIVRNIVTAHGGRIEVDFTPPEGGAAFTITLPLGGEDLEQLEAT